MGLLRPARPQGAARLHGDRARGVARGEQLRRPGRRGRRRHRDGSPARRWTFPDTPPLSTYNPVVLAGPFHEIRREVDGRDLGLLTRQSLAPQLDRDADEMFTGHGSRTRLLRRGLRDAVPADQVRPGVPARVRWRDGELRLRRLVRRLPQPDRSHARRARRAGPRAAARDGAHVVRQHRHDALVGRPVAQRGVRGVRLQLGDDPGDQLHRRVGEPPRVRGADGLPRRPGADVAPHPATDPRRGAGRCELRCDHLSQGRVLPGPADALHR